MKKLILSALACSMLLAGNFVNLQITNNTLMAEGQYKLIYNQPVYVRGGYLINDNKSNFVYGGIKSEGQAVGVNWPIKFSLIADFVHTKNNSAVPIGLGASGYLKYFSMPVFVRGVYEYAPKILSFDDADRFSKLKVETGVQFIENGEVFMGYRNISFNNNYNSSFYVGVGFDF